MPWMESSVSDQRKIIVALAQTDGVNIAQLAKRFGVSRKTIYKWKGRAHGHGEGIEGEWSEDRSRRPASCPWRTEEKTEQIIVALRREYPFWGPRKLHCLMRQRGHQAPSMSTIAAVLKRHGLVDPLESVKRHEYTRFERSEPNALWQMDFKGAFATGRGRCHPLTIVDDHSRFALDVRALEGESGELTRPALTAVFRRYGLPQCMLLDNGSCWGRREAGYSAFTAWLLRLGIGVIYARPFHPQTKGKNERFNRTLKAEAITGRNFSGLSECQEQFDRFVVTYNTIRPHQALEMATPASRYKVSWRAFPEVLPPLQYLEGDVIRTVAPAGFLSWNKQRYQIGRAFSGEPVAIRPTRVDGVFEVYYFYQRVAIINRHEESCRQT